ncbi:hypothetical protein [Colwellia sp. MB3u-55]|jgi:hypothetical protein|uniref:hypothetical protein n=1 Tax=Colwellia sp. MB3u-55 TaxID=2759810 RepID=UPI0015F69FBC|nr:hypothetical protein [Colwellia sp. MB3u-55]MBA6251790.1 hypothetical protein [Colwellia sp. MB3u-55]
MASWSNKELLSLCKSKISCEEKLLNIEQCIFAIPERLKLISIAITQVDSSVRNVIESMGLDEHILIDQVFGVAEDNVDAEISHARFKGLINLDFIIQSLHCCSEMLAHLINLILIGDKKNHYLYTISEKLAKSGDFPDLAKTINELIESESFKYIAAYTNESKHRQLIQVRHTADIKDYLVVTGFMRKGNVFPKKWNSDITNNIVKNIRPQIVRVGNEINRCVSQLTSTSNGTKTVG